MSTKKTEKPVFKANTTITTPKSPQFSEVISLKKLQTERIRIGCRKPIELKITISGDLSPLFWGMAAIHERGPAEFAQYAVAQYLLSEPAAKTVDDMINELIKSH